MRLHGRSLDCEGATAVEYAIMVSLIAVVIIASVTMVGRATFGLFDCAAEAVSGLPNDPDC